jgi:hypothetical protein
MYQQKYFKYKLKYLHLKKTMTGGGENKFIVNINDREKNPMEMTDDVALCNGIKLYNGFKIYLNKYHDENSPVIEGSLFRHLIPNEKDNYLKYYGREGNKKYLGRQFYLYNGTPDPTTRLEDIVDDDIFRYANFFNWLTHTTGNAVPMNGFPSYVASNRKISEIPKRMTLQEFATSRRSSSDKLLERLSPIEASKMIKELASKLASETPAPASTPAPSTPTPTPAPSTPVSPLIPAPVPTPKPALETPAPSTPVSPLIPASEIPAPSTPTPTPSTPAPIPTPAPTIHIIYWKYEQNKDDTHFEKLDYAKYIVKKIRELDSKQTAIKNFKIMLTNGTNKSFTSGGGGTNQAITKLNKKIKNGYFTQTKIISTTENLYENLHKDYTNLDAQDMTFDRNSYHVGTIIVSVPKDKTITPFYEDDSIFTYFGVFHINGFDFRGMEAERKDEIENSDKYQAIVTWYYSTIMQSFIEYAKNQTLYETFILHVATIPGNIYNGDAKIGSDCMHKALKLVNITGLTKSVFIVLDCDDPKGIRR